MNLLMLGNGFDLSNQLPTKYHNFLHVINLLISKPENTFTTVADVFATDSLQAEDYDIEKSYQEYQSSYAKCVLDQKKLLNLSH